MTGTEASPVLCYCDRHCNHRTACICHRRICTYVCSIHFSIRNCWANLEILIDNVKLPTLGVYQYACPPPQLLLLGVVSGVGFETSGFDKRIGETVHNSLCRRTLIGISFTSVAEQMCKSHLHVCFQIVFSTQSE